MSKKESNIIYRRLIRSYLSSVVSISLVLVLVGVAGIVAVNARAVSNFFKENITVSAFLPIDASEQDALSLEKKLSTYPYIKSVTYISKEEGIKEMKEMLGEDFLDVFEVNPIPVSLDLQIMADYISRDSLTMICEQLSSLDMIDDVSYEDSLVDLLNANLQNIGIVLGIFIILLLFISFVLINNTLRLNMYSKRFTIHTMRLVGATKGFIVKPFIGQAFFQGLISGCIAVLALLGILYLIRNEFHQLFSIFDYQLLGLLLAAVIALGVLICIACTALVVRKMISLTNDELYY